MADRTSNPAPTAPLYQQMPYPGDGVVRTTTARILERALRQHAPHLLKRKTLRIVDVGCGTGEVTCGLARMFPRSEVVGVDINDASLDLARGLADRAGLGVRFVRCDIAGDLPGQLAAAGVVSESDEAGTTAAEGGATADGRTLPSVSRGGAFDVVVSIGVLHHLAEPAAGFAQVRRLIRSDGIMVGMCYSKEGRWADVAIRRILDAGLPSDAGFRDRAQAVRLLRLSRKHTLLGSLLMLRRRWRFGPPLSLVELCKVRFRRHRLTHVSDTFSNPCEHLFSFAELERIFTETDWRFIALADQGGLPVGPREHTSDPACVRLLERFSRHILYDYFAFHYRASGFTFVLAPG